MRLLKQLLLSICLLCSAVCFADDITWSLSTNYSTYQSYSLSNANDGNTSTYFWSAEAQASDKYVLVTFSDYVDMTSFSTYSSNANDYPNTCNELQVSADGSNWTKIGDFQASQTSTFTDITDAQRIKYARIYGTGSTSGKNWLVINEITIEYTASPSSVTITRSVTPGEYVSFALPFDINVRELDTYFENVYQVSGTLFEDLWIGEDTGDPDEGGGGIGESKPTRFESMRKAAAEEEYVSENIPEDYSVHPPFAVYLNTAKSPATYHIFCHQIPKVNSDGYEYVIEAGQPFYAKVKAGVTEVTFTGEVAESEFVSGLDNVLTVCNYIDNAFTTNILSDYGVLEAEEREDVNVYTYNTDGTFTQAETNALEANHAYIISNEEDINIVVHYGSFENNVDMVKTVTRGDANRDGEVNTTDAVAVINYYLGKSTTIDKLASDMNDDESINTTDAVAIINKYLGK